jgi:osmotically-inducible protein OsmY
MATSPAPVTSTLADTQARVQEALRRDMPGSEIQASVTDDGSLQLTGSVATSDQKRRAEDIARSTTTNNQNIVNKITVRGEQAPDQTAVPR